jgi:hypothetical protein
MTTRINLNPGVRTVYAKNFNDLRRDVAGLNYNDANALADSAAEYQSKESAAAKSRNLANFLGAIADASAGRGVNKTTFGPAHARGYHMSNPHYFGMENKAPVPYDKMLSDSNNLRAVMSGF